MLEIHKTIKALHEALYKRCQEISGKIPDYATTKNVTDLAYMLDKDIELLNDSRKELERLRDKASDCGCVMLVMKGTGEPLAGQYATASGKPTKAVNIPSFHTEPERYKELCEMFGVPVDPLQRLHYPSLKEHMSNILAEAGQLPPEMDKFATHEKAVLIVKGRADNTLDKDSADVTGLLGE